MSIQIPTRIPEKIVVTQFSGILVNSGIQVEAGRPEFPESQFSSPDFESETTE